jgi:tetratricopeptide (TPR) repeat protein
MALRKEQVLVIASLLVGVLLVRSGGDDWVAPRPQRPTSDYEPRLLQPAPLLTGDVAVPGDRTWFREPSETQPLPPTSLPWPARQPLALVGLPLDPGPDFSRTDLLTMSGEVVAEAAVGGAAAGGGGDEIPDEEGVAPATAQATETQDPVERWARVYDRVYIDGSPAPMLGVVTVKGVEDRFALEEMSDFSAVTVELLHFRQNDQRLDRTPIRWDPDDKPGVVRIALANTMRNEVGRKVRQVPADIAHNAERLQLIDWLVEQGARDAAVFDEALTQVGILEANRGGVEALRAKCRVLRAMGDLNGELKLYESLQDAASQPFKYEGLGLLQQRLGLPQQAEQSLLEAVRLAPSDARPHAWLGAFLRQRGRPEQAAQSARKALARIGSVIDQRDRRDIVAVAIGCLLGIGDVDGARQALASLGAVTTGSGAYLMACIEYAAADFVAAGDGFRNAAALGYGPAALLGLAASQVRTGAYGDAVAGFRSVIEQAPLLRARALTGIALVELKGGQTEAAMSQIDRALEADPTDPYALYLRARAQMAQGLQSAALESLMQALTLRDDFVPVLAAVAEAQLRMAADAGASVEGAERALSAMRYADRANELAAASGQSVQAELRLQAALAHYAALDLRGALSWFRRVLDQADDEASRLCAQAGVVVVEYAMGRTSAARFQLSALLELPQSHPMRQWAEATQLRIDDHAQKEQLDDRFEREEIGNIWDAPGGFAAESGRLVLKGTLRRDVRAERRGAVQRGGRFLGVGISLELGAAHQQCEFVGLRIQTQSGGSGAAELVAQIGYRRGRPHVRVVDGRDEPTNVAVDGVNASGPQQLMLRVEPRQDGRQFDLVCTWNGAVVHSQPIKRLNASTGNPLETLLVVQGQPGTNVDVRFDDYHLERRKDG